MVIIFRLITVIILSMLIFSSSHHHYRLINNNLTSPITPWVQKCIHIKTNESISSDSLPVGLLTLSINNFSPKGSTGEITLSSGSVIPEKLIIPALNGMAEIYGIQSKAESIKILNTSKYQHTPIEVCLFFPGLSITKSLTPNGKPYFINHKEAIRIQSKPRRMNLELRAPGDFSVILVYRGDKPALYLLNAEHKDYPFIKGLEVQSVTGNTVNIEDQYTGELIFIVNLSPLNANNLSVKFTSL
ncbi:hypothetical protein L4D09_27990 [Photobacterium makurazakiensis]|uniref:hypothetical protein n=1 Tax=Photobacterium makurazakiensis TaxID=2910234 RepID=UPI003D12009D